MSKKYVIGLWLVITVLVGVLGLTAYVYNQRGLKVAALTELVQKQDARIQQYQGELMKQQELIGLTRQQSAEMIAAEKKMRLDAMNSFAQYKTEIEEQKAQAMAIAQAEMKAQEQAAAKKAAEVPQRFKFLKTTDGRIYFRVKVMEVDQEGVTIMHSDGGTKLTYAQLPQELAQKFQATSN